MREKIGTNGKRSNEIMLNCIDLGYFEWFDFLVLSCNALRIIPGEPQSMLMINPLAILKLVIKSIGRYLLLRLAALPDVHVLWLSSAKGSLDFRSKECCKNYINS